MKRREEVWQKDWPVGSESNTSTLTANVDNPINSKKIVPISAELSSRKLYFCVVTADAVLKGWIGQFKFFRKKTLVHTIDHTFLGDAGFILGADFERFTKYPALPFKRKGLGMLDISPNEAYADSRILQWGGTETIPLIYNHYIMLPTELEIEADGISSEVNLVLNTTMSTARYVFTNWGIVSEGDVEA